MTGLTRRLFIGSSASLAEMGWARTATSPIAAKSVARVIIDNDFAGDPDGLVALAYQLLAPLTRVVLVTSSALDPKLVALVGNLPAGRTAARGAAIAESVTQLAVRAAPPIVAGAETFGTSVAQVTPAAHAIVAEARRPDPLPLFVTCGGPLTNVAAALRVDPTIARRLTVIWIGGRAAQGGGAEYNLATDAAAAIKVVEASDVTLWQVPQEAYDHAMLSRAELAADLRPLSPLASWLVDRMAEVPSFVPPTGFKGLGDCAMVPLVSVSPEAGSHVERPARRLRQDLTLGQVVTGRTIRLYETLDIRLMVADMLATFRLQDRS